MSIEATAGFGSTRRSKVARRVAKLALSWMRSTRNIKPGADTRISFTFVKRRPEVSWTIGPRLEASRATQEITPFSGWTPIVSAVWINKNSFARPQPSPGYPSPKLSFGPLIRSPVAASPQQNSSPQIPDLPENVQPRSACGFLPAPGGRRDN